MTVAEILDGYRRFWYSLFKWRNETTLLYKSVLALSFAALTGLAAQVRIPLPWTPVPITAQTLVVLLSGVYLGKWWGGISQGLYWGVGALGVPWGAGLRGGLGWAVGPTAGYLLGFVIAALLVGYLTDRYSRSRTLQGNIPLMLLATAVIYLFGVSYLMAYFSFEIGDAIVKGMLPFLPGDLLKAFAATAVVKVTVPKKVYGGQADRDS